MTGIDEFLKFQKELTALARECGIDKYLKMRDDRVAFLICQYLQNLRDIMHDRDEWNTFLARMDKTKSAGINTTTNEFISSPPNEANIPYNGSFGSSSVPELPGGHSDLKSGFVLENDSNMQGDRFLRAEDEMDNKLVDLEKRYDELWDIVESLLTERNGSVKDFYDPAPEEDKSPVIDFPGTAPHEDKIPAINFYDPATDEASSPVIDFPGTAVDQDRVPVINFFDPATEEDKVPVINFFDPATEEDKVPVINFFDPAPEEDKVPVINFFDPAPEEDKVPVIDFFEPATEEDKVPVIDFFEPATEEDKVPVIDFFDPATEEDKVPVIDFFDPAPEEDKVPIINFFDPAPEEAVPTITFSEPVLEPVPAPKPVLEPVPAAKPEPARGFELETKSYNNSNTTNMQDNCVRIGQREAGFHISCFKCVKQQECQNSQDVKRAARR